MKISYMSWFDPRSITTWSGSSYYLLKALTSLPSIDLEIIGPLDAKSSPLFELKKTAYSKLLGKNFLPNVDPAVLRSYAEQAETSLAQSNSDFILSLSAPPIAYLETKKPIIYFWDCTFQGNLEYPWFKNLATESISNGHEMERRALENCRKAIYSSEWAAQSAINFYRAPRNKVSVLPLGANLDSSRTTNDAIRLIESRSRNRCQLLFLGLDWVRKGGQLALEIAEQLNLMGLETELTVVGCQPHLSEPVPPFVRSLGFINKFDPGGSQRIAELLARSHFLLVPSIAESFGCVFCEASSFATPSLARKVGGVPSAVRTGVNGELFPTGASALDYCDYIIGLFKDYERYKNLALSSFAEYQSRLNWNSTAAGILRVFDELFRP